MRNTQNKRPLNSSSEPNQRRRVITVHELSEKILMLGRDDAMILLKAILLNNQGMARDFLQSVLNIKITDETQNRLQEAGLLQLTYSSGRTLWHFSDEVQHGCIAWIKEQDEKGHGHFLLEVNQHLTTYYEKMSNSGSKEISFTLECAKYVRKQIRSLPVKAQLIQHGDIVLGIEPSFIGKIYTKRKKYEKAEAFYQENTRWLADNNMLAPIPLIKNRMDNLHHQKKYRAAHQLIKDSLSASYTLAESEISHVYQLQLVSFLTKNCQKIVNVEDLKMESKKAYLQQTVFYYLKSLKSDKLCSRESQQELYQCFKSLIQAGKATKPQDFNYQFATNIINVFTSNKQPIPAKFLSDIRVLVDILSVSGSNEKKKQAIELSNLLLKIFEKHSDRITGSTPDEATRTHAWVGSNLACLMYQFDEELAQTLAKNAILTAKKTNGCTPALLGAYGVLADVAYNKNDIVNAKFYARKSLMLSIENSETLPASIEFKARALLAKIIGKEDMGESKWRHQLLLKDINATILKVTKSTAGNSKDLPALYKVRDRIQTRLRNFSSAPKTTTPAAASNRFALFGATVPRRPPTGQLSLAGTSMVRAPSSTARPSFPSPYVGSY